MFFLFFNRIQWLSEVFWFTFNTNLYKIFGFFDFFLVGESV
jgi:hypothetical protein